MHFNFIFNQSLATRRNKLYFTRLGNLTLARVGTKNRVDSFASTAKSEIGLAASRRFLLSRARARARILFCTTVHHYGSRILKSMRVVIDRSVLPVTIECIYLRNYAAANGTRTCIYDCVSSMDSSMPCDAHTHNAHARIQRIHRHARRSFSCDESGHLYILDAFLRSSVLDEKLRRASWQTEG